MKKRIKFKFNSLVVLFMVLLMSTACVRDVNLELKNSFGLAIPIGTARLTLDSSISNIDLLTTNSNGLLMFVFKESVVSPDYSDGLDFDYSKFDTIDFVIPPIFNNGDTLKMIDTILNSVDLGDARMDSIFVQSGMMKFNVVTLTNYPLHLTLLTPGLTKNGVPLSIDYYIAANAPPYQFQIPIDGYRFVMDNSAGNINRYDQQLTIRVGVTADPRIPAYEIVFEQDLVDIELETAFGYCGQDTIQLFDSEMEFSAFNNEFLKNITFLEPIINLDIKNYQGVPVKAHFNEISLKKGSQTVLFTSSILNSLLIPQAASVGNFGTFSTEFNTTNSNIADAFNFHPEKMILNADVITNPSGYTTANFAIDTGRFYGDATITLPVYGKAMEVVLFDTIDMDLEGLAELDSTTILLNIKNAFPVEANLQLYLMDINGNYIDSLFADQGGFINAATVGAAPDYFVTDPTATRLEIENCEDFMENFHLAEFLIAKVSISTLNSGQDIIKIYDDSYFEVKISAKSKYNLELSN